jgi:hypothetical protein
LNEEVPTAFGGAIDDSHFALPTGFLPDVVTGMEHTVNPVPNSTYAVWANDDLLYTASGAGLRILNISDPTNPSVVSEDIVDSQSRDVDLMFHPNGRLYAVLADIGENGIRLVDVTEPEFPEFVSKSEKCTHNIAVVPGTTLVYSSFSLCHAEDLADGDNTHLTVVDFADPLNPVEYHHEFPPQVETVGGTPREVDATSCHQTSFQMDRNLGYCAGISQTLIFDIEDPVNPVIIQVIDWPGVNIHHAVYPAHGGDMLILGDEVAGVIAPVPACSQNADYPTSALWFFDTSDLTTPTPLGYFQQSSYEAANTDVDSAGDLYCSTHFGSLVEDRDLFVLGWYSAGTILVDFSDPTAPTQVDGWKGDGIISTTDSLYYKGHVYSTDGVRGVDVLKLI